MVAQQETDYLGEKVKTMSMMMMMIKGKRSKRSRLSSPSPSSLTISTTDEAASTVSNDYWTTTTTAAASEEEQDMARCLILLAQGPTPTPTPTTSKTNPNNINGTTSLSYECKTCSRTFPSFQALGGHRTSHKKPKLSSDPTAFPVDLPKPSPIFSIKDEDDDCVSLTLQMGTSRSTLTTPNNNSSMVKVKVHECSICGAEFSSGQALGGHMRRHRPIAHALKQHPVLTAAKTGCLSLDLNLPAPEEDHMIQHRDQQHSSKFVFSSNEKTLVFTASSLVDCHY